MGLEEISENEGYYLIRRKPCETCRYVQGIERILNYCIDCDNNGYIEDQVPLLDVLEKLVTPSIIKEDGKWVNTFHIFHIKERMGFIKRKKTL